MHVKNNTSLHSNKKGFTIVELMIATTVFTVILLLMVVSILYITRSYYKGIAHSKVQNASRNSLEAVSEAIRFGSAGPSFNPATGTPYQSGVARWFCVGNKIFAYKLGYQLDGPNAATSTSDYAFVVAQMPNTACPGTGPEFDALGIAAGTAPGQIELLEPNMRLSDLQVKPSALASNAWRVNVQVTFGDDDLLCNPLVIDCTSNAVMGNVNDFTINPGSTDPNNRVICKTTSGNQFCAFSRVSSVVQTRIVPAGG